MPLLICLFCCFWFVAKIFLLTEMKNEIVNKCVYTVHNDEDDDDEEDETSQ